VRDTNFVGKDKSHRVKI